MNKGSKFKKIFKNKIVIASISTITLIVVVGIIVSFNLFGLKKELTLEIGSSNLSINTFFKRGKVLSGYTLVTDLSSIDLNKVGDYTIKLSKKGKEYKTKLHIVDTTSPIVIFKDSFGYTDYELNENDFIESITEYSNYEIKVLNRQSYNEFGEYDVSLKVVDEYGNETLGNVKLYITYMKREYSLELGNSLKKEDIVYDVSKYGQYVEDSYFENINKSPVGRYIVLMNYENESYECAVNIVDTTAPMIETLNASVYDGQTVEVDNFIKSVKELSKYETKIISEIDYELIGEQNVQIEAIDEYGNSSIVEVILSINYDKDPPQFSGIADVTLNKYSNFDFKSGITATDKKDGKIDYSVDTSSVNLNAYGTYYATYTAKDAAGNTTTVKRKISINHDSTDTNNKVNAFMANAGNDPKTILYYVRNSIPYSYDWGGDDPVWFALTNYKGNCYVHALLYLSILQKKGYEAKLIWNYPKTHYWVIVNMGNGTWRHCDPTPTDWHRPVDCVTDDVRYANLQGNNWDRSLWPAAV